MPAISSALTAEGEDASLAKREQRQTGYTRSVPRKPQDCFSMLTSLCFTQVDTQEWDKLKTEELNRRKHAHLDKKT